MIKKIVIASMLLLFSLHLHAQKKEKIKGSKNVTINETSINAFNRIVVGEDFKIDLIESAKASVFIETDDNLHDVINFEVKDSTLYFSTSQRISSSKKMNIKVSYTNALKFIETIDDGEVSSLTSLNLDTISLMHSGNSRAYLNIKTTLFKLVCSERAKVKLNVTASNATLELNDNSKTEALIKADTLQVDLYQRSDADLEGDVTSLEVRADNSTNFVGKNLSAISCQVIADLNADVYVNASEDILIEATGNSEVYLYGTPNITLTKFQDTAKLHKKEL